MQDKAFVQIGRIVLQNLGNKEPYQLFIQNMFPEKENYLMIVAIFEFTKNVESGYDCNFQKIDPQNVSSLNYEKYAYRKGSARGGDITFTTKFGDIEKKLRTLVDNQLKTLVGRAKATTWTNEGFVFDSLFKFLNIKENFEIVKKELADFYETLSKDDKTSSGLSLMFKIDGVDTYLSDFNVIQQILNSSGTEEKSEKYGVISEGKDAHCSICCEKKPILHGFASPFKYATVDKPGMVSGFFRQENNWKNYPICTDCSIAFELGRSYVTSNLSGYFYGNPYYCIPKTLLSKDLENLEKAMTRLSALYKNITADAQKIKVKEDGLQRMIANEDDYFNMNLLFYEENPTTKAIKIKLMLEEIVPSRFRQLFIDVPTKINQNPLFENAISIKKEQSDLKFSFGILKTFFEEDFHDVIQKVFMLQTIALESLYAKFMNVIRANYNKAQTSDGYVEMTRLTVLKAVMTITYFKELKIIESHLTPSSMDIIEESEKKSSFDLEKLVVFVEQNKGFLDTDYKIGIFGVGILVRLLLNMQHASLGNTPFEKKLKGYHLSPELLKNIYIEALSKISQYQGFYTYSNLREFIEKYFLLNIIQINKLSNNEVSFYFVAGIEFGNQFKNKDNKENQD